MIWAIFFLICLPVAFFLLKGGRDDIAETGAADHYRAQLKEIETDREKGVLSGGEADQARLEIERRILRLADEKDSVVSESGGSRPVFPVLIVFILGSFAFYAQMGQPGLSSASTQQSDMLAQQVTEGGPSYAEAIQKIELHLDENPTDAQGWEVLATSARGMRQFSKAANAFARLAELEPANLNWRIQELEAFIAMARGQVTPAARMIIDKLLDTDPNHPAGHYYLGVMQQQAGNEDVARSIWLALADRSAPDAPWMPAVRSKLQQVGVGAPKLSEADQAMVNDMTEEERDVFIQSMIDRLKSRLESSPDDAEGWLMLARSQAALGDTEAAKATLQKAISLVDDTMRPGLQAFLDNLQQ